MIADIEPSEMGGFNSEIEEAVGQMESSCLLRGSVAIDSTQQGEEVGGSIEKLLNDKYVGTDEVGQCDTKYRAILCGLLNVNSLYGTARTNLLDNFVLKHNICIMMVTETKLKTKKSTSMRLCTPEDTHLYMSRATLELTHNFEPRSCEGDKSEGRGGGEG